MDPLLPWSRTRLLPFSRIVQNSTLASRLVCASCALLMEIDWGVRSAGALGPCASHNLRIGRNSFVFRELDRNKVGEGVRVRRQSGTQRAFMPFNTERSGNAKKPGLRDPAFGC
jgi:hypothetical protein